MRWGSLVCFCAIAIGACYLHHDPKRPSEGPAAEVDVPEPGFVPWTCPPPTIEGELAVIANDTLQLVAADGTAQELIRFERPQPVYAREGVTAAGPWIAAFAWSAMDSPGEAVVDMVIGCRTGGVVWQARERFGYANWGNTAVVRGNADGHFAFSFGFGDDSLVVATAPSGVTIEHEPYDVRGRPGPDGTTLVARRGTGSSVDFEWFDPTGMRFLPTRYEEGGAGSRISIGDVLVYGLSGGARLRVEGPSDAFTIPVVPPPSDVDYLQLERTDDERWLLIEERLSGSLLAFSTVDIRAQTSSRFELAPPDALEAWSDPRDSTPGAWIARDGAVLEVYRDERQATLMRTRDGIIWEPLGHPLTDVTTWFLAEAGGVVLLLGREGSGGQWADGASADVLRGRSAQLIAASRTTVLPSFALSLRLAHDGRAAAGWVDGRLMRFDAKTGESLATGVGYDTEASGYRTAVSFTGGEDRPTYVR